MNKELMEFADKLEKACIDTIESGRMTKDLALITSLENPEVKNTQEFIKEIRKTLDGLIWMHWGGGEGGGGQKEKKGGGGEKKKRKKGRGKGEKEKGGGGVEKYCLT